MREARASRADAAECLLAAARGEESIDGRAGAQLILEMVLGPEKG